MTKITLKVGDYAAKTLATTMRTFEDTCDDVEEGSLSSEMIGRLVNV